MVGILVVESAVVSIIMAGNVVVPATTRRENVLKIPLPKCKDSQRILMTDEMPAG
jgi:hypothetical protein